MAVLLYGDERFEFDELLLAHVKIVVTQKLRRRESFLLSWQHPAEEGGRSSIWLSTASDLHFRFSEERPPVLDDRWLQALMEASYASRGLDVASVPRPARDGV